MLPLCVGCVEGAWGCVAQGFGSLGAGRSSVEQLCTREEAWGDTGFALWPPYLGFRCCWPCCRSQSAGWALQKGRAVRDRKAWHGKFHTVSNGIQVPRVFMAVGLCPERVQE